MTQETLFGGKMVLAQPARGEGYRTNVDALLLADFARRAPGGAKVAFDLGAGVGAIGLALLHWGAVERVVLVEADLGAAALARANLAANGWAERGVVLEGHAGGIAREHRGDASLVVCNPPYVAPGRGRAAKGASRSLARSGDLGVFVAAARTLLGRRGRACFVYPAQEMVGLLASLREAGLEPKRLRAVHATPERAARVVMVEAMPAKAGGLVVEAPLVEREGDGASAEVERIVRG